MAQITQAKQLQFEQPSFFKRLRGMLGVDFYRLFHPPMFYIFLVIAALIPALVSMGSFSGTGQEAGNAWNIIASNSPLYVVNDIGEYANMNMVFIFGGIMVSIFIGHDYRSGYAKNLFTVRAKRTDYVISKSLVGFIGGAGMLVCYFIGAMIGGAIAGLSFDAGVSAGRIVACLFSKLFLMAVYAAIYLLLAVVAKQRLWMSIVGSLAVGALLFMMIPMMTPLNAGILNVILCLAGGAIFGAGLGAVSNFILKKTSLV